MSIEQSGNPGSDKPSSATVEDIKEMTPEEHLQHEANKLANKSSRLERNSESNNLFTK